MDHSNHPFNYFKTIILVLFFALFVPALSFGQKVKMKWGKYAKDELSFTQYKQDTSAAAVVLFDIGQMDCSPKTNLTVERHIRIKILKPEAVEKSNIRIPFYAHNGIERINRVKGRAVRLTPKGKLKEYKLSSDEIHTVDIGKYWKEIRFTFPAVEAGTILEYKYTLYSEDLLSMSDWNFQHDIPVVHSEFSARIDNSLEVNLLLNGRRVMNKYGGKAVNNWVLTHLPPIAEEPFCPNPEDYTERIRFQLAGYFTKTAMGAIERKSLLTDWNGIRREVLESGKMFPYLNSLVSLTDQEKAIVKSSKSDHEKMVDIYRYIHQEFQWNRRNSIFPSQSRKSFYQSKTGNSSEINLSMMRLLNEAGLNTHAVLVSTRNHGKVSKVYPLLRQFNHLIVKVTIDQKDYFLDASNFNLAHSTLPLKNFNGWALVLDKPEVSWVNLKADQNYKAIINTVVDLRKDADSDLTYNVHFFGYQAQEQRSKFFSAENEVSFVESFLESTDHFSLLPESVTLQNTHDFEKKFHVKFSCDLANPIQEQEVIYLPASLDKQFLKNPFKAPKRHLPIDFIYTKNSQYIGVIHLPEGYVPEEIPQNVKVKVPGINATYTRQISYRNGTLQISRTFDLKDTYILKSRYARLQEFFNIVIEKEQEMIVLKRTGIN